MQPMTLWCVPTTQPNWAVCGCVWTNDEETRLWRSTRIISSLASAFINRGLIYQRAPLRHINVSDYGPSRSSRSIAHSIRDSPAATWTAWYAIPVVWAIPGHTIPYHTRPYGLDKHEPPDLGSRRIIQSSSPTHNGSGNLTINYIFKGQSFVMSRI